LVHGRPTVVTVIFFTFLLISSEIYLHYAGFGSFPICDIDNEIQYIPHPNFVYRALAVRIFLFLGLLNIVMRVLTLVSLTTDSLRCTPNGYAAPY